MAKKYLFIGGPMHGDRMMVTGGQNSIFTSDAILAVAEEIDAIGPVDTVKEYVYNKRRWQRDGKVFEFFLESNTTDEAASALLERPIYTLM